MHNIFSHTEPTPPDGYPAYLSINRDDGGRHTITVRSRGNGGRDVATIEVSNAVLARLAVALFDPRKRLGYGGTAIVPADSARSVAAIPVKLLISDKPKVVRTLAAADTHDGRKLPSYGSMD